MHFKLQCAYCNEAHFAASCEKVVDKRKRKDILRRDKRCFVCLRIAHTSHDCQNKTGIVGNSIINQFVCKSSPWFSRFSSSHRGEAKHSQASSSSPSAESEHSSTLSTSATGPFVKGRTVLLRTVYCNATNPVNMKSTMAHVLFDTGSQRTYVTNSLKSRLGLKPVEKEFLRLNTFGNVHTRRESCDIVNLMLSKKDGENIRVSASHHMFIITIESGCQHLSSSWKSDKFNGEYCDSLDVLIGSDYYWSVVNGEVIRGE